MSRIAYVDGRYLRYAEARVPIDDRGYQFGDGIYEVCEIRDGALIDETRHLARFERSLAALRIRAPTSLAALRFIMREIVARNRVRDGIVYVQATRGAARPPPPRSRLSRTQDPSRPRRHGAGDRPAGRRGARRQRRAGDQRPGFAMGAARYKEPATPAQCPGQAGGARPRRL